MSQDWLLRYIRRQPTFLTVTFSQHVPTAYIYKTNIFIAPNKIPYFKVMPKYPHSLLIMAISCAASSWTAVALLLCSWSDAAAAEVPGRCGERRPWEEDAEAVVSLDEVSFMPPLGSSASNMAKNSLYIL